MHTITLVRDDNDMNAWLAVYSDPLIYKLFGTDTLPTAYRSSIPAVTVLAAIKELNPECDVRLA